jgi:RHS repeat-associated protein
MNAGLTQVLSDGGNTYLYGAARPSGAMRIGELQAGGMAYHLGDALGSVRQLTDASGSVTLARNFEPYGKVLGGTGSGSTTFAFTGEQLDAGTGFTFLRARYYNGALGRFFQKDAFSGDVLQPQTFNKYRYALNNPILLTEPSGNCEGVCWTIILIIALASAACTSAPAPTATPTIIFNTPTSPPQPTLTALPSQLKTLQDIANKYQIGLPPGMRFDFADAPGFDLSKWSRERLDQWAANEALATTGLSETGLYLGFSIPVAGSYTINIPGKPTGPWADEAVYVTEAAFPYYNNDEISIAGIMVHEARHAWQEYVLEENVTVKHQDELISAYEDLKNADVTGTSYGQYLEYDSFKAQVSFLEAHGQPNLQALQDAKEGLTYAENLFTPSQEFAGYLKIWDKIWDELPNVRVP